MACTHPARERRLPGGVSGGKGWSGQGPARGTTELSPAGAAKAGVGRKIAGLGGTGPMWLGAASRVPGTGLI
ncbi:hypothetical protein GCM10010109_56200 [Actinoplanes campanulatus]|nr:hypothetical protein GCM10010109_56200 [Actinoplanes campanulatus]GID38395.1 hypothetical protein Aca09nite_49010 [Actinoplanes campanulatus]